MYRRILKYKFFWLLLLVSVVCQADSNSKAIDYNCKTVQLGHQIPIRLYKVKKAFQKECGNLCKRSQVVRYSELGKEKVIPGDWIEKQEDFNLHLLQAETLIEDGHNSLKTRIHPLKRFVYVSKQNETYILETKYVTYEHANMTVSLKCQKKGCYGELIKSELYFPKTAIQDKRADLDSIKVQFLFGKKDPSRLIARISKNYIHDEKKAAIQAPLSSTGEVFISEASKSFNLDAGVDEQLFIYKDSELRPVFQRIPAAELKLICQKN